MCGIAGWWRWQADVSAEALDARLRAMAETLRHRGPDGDGRWLDAQAGVGLAHRRLAIVDLTPTGAQPMVSQDGRWVLVFNGEIYNFPGLRQDLAAAGVSVRSTGDSEVMLESFARWGIDSTCRRMAGMFAFAAWDRRERTLTLGRDRLGKKPLYLQRSSHGVAFASELKALLTLPGFAPALDARAVADFFAHGYVPEGSCILAGVEKVQPGELVALRADGGVVRQRYWTLQSAAAAARRWALPDETAAKAELIDRLQLATRERMLADVPLGAFLSGGIDSGLVVAMMQRAGLGTTRTFSIGFEEGSHDEAPVARAVAHHLGTRHTDLYVTQAHAIGLVPQLPEIFDEPFADASQIPTVLLARLARQHVTVALTGDGGDEAFGGYLRYRNEYGLTGGLYHCPRPLRSGLSGLLTAVPAGAWEGAAAWLPRRRRPRFLASKVGKLARALALDTREQRAREYLTVWSPESLLTDALLSDAGARHDPPVPAELADSEAMQYWETLHYLPGDLLTKMDRATMWASLEARSPLLDHRVVELAWQLAPDLKAGPRALKYLLRQALFDFVPRALVDLPKQGFSVPVGAWMKDALRPLVEDALDHCRRELPHLVRREAVDEAWTSHLQGRVGQTERIWSLVMFSLWMRRWMGQGA